MQSCELCGGLRGHARLLDDTFELFNAEYYRATREWHRLKELFHDVCWYSFETKCRLWKDPWCATLGDSHIELHGVSHTTHRHSEMTSFPEYYQGPVSAAPDLPVEIILIELKQAHEYMLETEKGRFACYDYAPGGRAYEKLLREGEGVRLYNALGSKQSSETSVDGRDV